jgi:hypothetical protein
MTACFDHAHFTVLDPLKYPGDMCKDAELRRPCYKGNTKIK